MARKPGLLLADTIAMYTTYYICNIVMGINLIWNKVPIFEIKISWQTKYFLKLNNLE